MKAPYGFLDFIFRYGGFKPKPVLVTDKGRNIRDHFLHEVMRDMILIGIQTLKESSYLCADGCLPLDEGAVLGLKFSHAVPSLPVSALILEELSI